MAKRKRRKKIKRKRSEPHARRELRKRVKGWLIESDALLASNCYSMREAKRLAAEALSCKVSAQVINRELQAGVFQWVPFTGRLGFSVSFSARAWSRAIAVAREQSHLLRRAPSINAAARIMKMHGVRGASPQMARGCLHILKIPLADGHVPEN